MREEIPTVISCNNPEYGIAGHGNTPKTCPNCRYTPKKDVKDPLVELGCNHPKYKDPAFKKIPMERCFKAKKKGYEVKY